MDLVDFEHSYMKKFCLDSFQVTEGNKEAIRHSNQFVRSFSMGPTILSIYGSVGNGKTHLLGATCNEIRNTLPRTRILVASFEVIESADITCNLLVLDSADLVLKSGQLSEDFLLNLKRRNISVLVSSAIRPSKYLLGIPTSSFNYYECEIDPPSPKELSQFVDWKPQSFDRQVSLASIDSFRRAEAEIFKAKIRRELHS